MRKVFSSWLLMGRGGGVFATASVITGFASSSFGFGVLDILLILPRCTSQPYNKGKTIKGNRYTGNGKGWSSPKT